MNLSERGIGQSLLALAVLLVALLMLMMALSLGLRAGFAEAGDGWAFLFAGLSVFGLAYLVLAWGLWRSRHWCWSLSLLLLPLVVSAGLVEAGRNNLLDLGTTLILLLTFIANLSVIMALFLKRHARK